MNPAGSAAWIVLKFGGTSVSTLSNWRNIAAVVRQRRTHIEPEFGREAAMPLFERRHHRLMRTGKRGSLQFLQPVGNAAEG